MTTTDVAVIGGGFYGAMIAANLSEKGFDVVICERENRLLARASTLNQARIHRGYHYPRSLATGLGSQSHYRRFIEEFPEAVVTPRVSLYATARNSSLTTSAQFEAFCGRIGAPCTPAAAEWRGLFSESLVTSVFEVEEAVFDSTALAAAIGARLERSTAEVRFSTKVVSIEPTSGSVRLETSSGDVIAAKKVINCTYSEINSWSASERQIPVQNEWTEIALCEAPTELSRVAITVIDGPFFSLMPFPAAGPGVSSLSHVRYTPRVTWSDEMPADHPQTAQTNEQSRFPAMLADASRYVPAIGGAKYLRSAYETKTIPEHREQDDARPVVFMTAPEDDPRVASVMGSKLDLIYDVLPAVEQFVTAGAVLSR